MAEKPPQWAIWKGLGREWRLVALLLAIYLAGAVTLALVRLPHEDEGHFANGAAIFIHEGRLAMPMWTEWAPSLDRCLFVTMPLYFLEAGVWTGIFGSALDVVRMNSVLWGLALVACWFAILRLLTPSKAAAIAGLVLIAANYDVMNLTSGRYDVMCAALNAAGILSYLYFRESSLNRAVLWSNTFVAMACFTHPYGVFGMGGIAVFFLFLDARRFRFHLLLLAALPYLLLTAGWGLYIMRHPAEFREQMAINSSGRLRFLAMPLAAIRSEVIERYVQGIAGFRAGVPLYMRVKVLLLVAYVAGFLGCFLTPAIRRDRKLLALAVYGLVAAAFLTYLDGERSYIYLVHALPAYGAVAGVWAGRLFERGGALRAVVAAGLALFVAYSLATVGYRARQNEYGRVYEPTLAFLRSHVQPGDLVLGGAEFGPGLGFREHVLADWFLGYRSGLKPRWIVTDSGWDEWVANTLIQQNPKAYEYVTRTLAGYRVAYRSPGAAKTYAVYERM